MRVMLRLFLSLWFVSADAQFCFNPWGQLNATNITGKAERAWEPQYYTWETIKHVYTGLGILIVGLILCAGAQFFCIALRSRICSCDRGVRRHKTHFAAVFAGVSSLFLAATVSLEVAFGSTSQDARTTKDIESAYYAFHALIMGQQLSITPAIALFYTSIADMAYPNKAQAGCRRLIYITFWCFAGVHALRILSGFIVMFILAFLNSKKFSVLSLILANQAITNVLIIVGAVPLLLFLLLFSNALVCIAHREMRKVSRHLCRIPHGIHLSQLLQLITASSMSPPSPIARVWVRLTHTFF